ELNANDPLAFLKADPPDAIDFAQVVDGAHGCLVGSCAVAVSHFQLRHGTPLPPPLKLFFCCPLKIQQSTAYANESNMNYWLLRAGCQHDGGYCQICDRRKRPGMRDDREFRHRETQIRSRRQGLLLLLCPLRGEIPR